MLTHFLPRLDAHYEHMKISNQRALAQFRAELRRADPSPPEDKDKYLSTCIQTVDESRTSSHEPRPDDLMELLQEEQTSRCPTVQKDLEFWNRFRSSNRGWTITHERENQQGVEKLPQCT